MIVYDRLWETMKRKDISQYRLTKVYGISSGQINRLKKNMYVSTHTISVLCSILDCPVEDVMEYRLDISQDTGVNNLNTDTYGEVACTKEP